MFKQCFLITFLVSSQLFGTTLDRITTIFKDLKMPFLYDMHQVIYHAEKEDADVLIYFHGYGGNGTEAHKLHLHNFVSYHIVSFDFPDANITKKQRPIADMAYGTIHELLPALYILKQSVIAGALKKIHLYGFSAGGGAIINILKVLVTNEYDEDLSRISITQTDKRALLQAIQQGHVILDCPLKSVDEIIDFRGYSDELGMLAKRYAQNNLVPLNSLDVIASLPLTLFLYFQNPDEIIFNRDDALFFEKLSRNTDMRLYFMTADNGGHGALPHASLWDMYHNVLNTEMRSIPT